MIKFSETKQAFYNTDLSYPALPADLVDVNQEQHIRLLADINRGCYVYADLTITDPRPSPFHVLENHIWIDPRTEEQKRLDFLKKLRPLTRRQFKLTLLENGLTETIEAQIQQIADPYQKAKISIEYQEATEFHRTSESINYMASLLNLTDQQLDDMWLTAMQY